MSVRDHVATNLQRIPRLRTLGLIAVAGVLCTSACTNGSRNDPVTEYSTDLTLTGDSPVAATRSLQRGVYVIEAREIEIDAHLTVAVGGVVSELEDRIPRYGATFKVVSLAEPGDVEIRVRSADHRTITIDRT